MCNESRRSNGVYVCQIPHSRAERKGRACYPPSNIPVPISNFTTASKSFGLWQTTRSTHNGFSTVQVISTVFEVSTEQQQCSHIPCAASSAREEEGCQSDNDSCGNYAKNGNRRLWSKRYVVSLPYVVGP